MGCKYDGNNYSNGAVMWQCGNRCICQDGEWKQLHDLNASSIDSEHGIELNGIRNATDKEVIASEKVSIEDSYAEVTTVRTIRRYAETLSVVKVSPYIYFSGRATRSQFCTLNFIDYRMYLDDLTFTSGIKQCEGIFYRVLEFEVEEET